MNSVLLAIADCLPGALPDRSTGGRALHAVGPGPVAVLAEEAAGAPAGPGSPASAQTATPGALWEHERAVGELMESFALLPVRYGTRLAPAQAEAFVRERREELLTALDRVRGAVEVAVSVRSPQPVSAAAARADAAGPGTAYLRWRLERSRATARMQDQLGPLAELARESAWPSPREGRETLSAAFLVARERLRAFAERARGLDETCPELELLVTGPWPPYSFSGGLL